MKKMILPMLALVAGIAFSAFTHKEHKPTSALYFQFTGDIADGSEYINMANWTETDEEGVGCSSGELPCVVDASDISGVTNKQTFAQYLDGLSDDGESFVASHTLSSRE